MVRGVCVFHFISPLEVRQWRPNVQLKLEARDDPVTISHQF